MLNIAIIGFGRIGAEHAGWIGRCGAARVAGVFDATDARRRLAEQRGLVAFDSIDQLLARDGVDAVLVATPTSMHAEHAMAALQAGKHVMIEKPMALDAGQARQLAEQARSGGRVLSVFHNRRWDRDVLTVRRAIESGALGRVFNIESRLGQFASCVGPAAREYRPNWRNEAGFGGGGLYDWGSHFVDQLWRLLWPARPTGVFAQLRGNLWSSDCDDLARVCINFDSGAVGMVEINTTTTRPLPRWHIDGTLGSGDSPHSPTFDTHAWARLTHQPPAGESHQLPLAEPGLDNESIWAQFAAACQQNARPAVTVQSVLQTMTLLDAARQSSAEFRMVPIDATAWTLD